MAERITIEALQDRVAALLRKQERLFLAMDGPSASGKTTLAKRLRRELGWTVVHMDDFFLSRAQRTPERYAVPGGNVDHERFLAEVLEPLRAGNPAVYRPLNCRTMEFAAPVRTEPGQVVLAEGAYACHPALWDYYDLRLFLTVDPALQRQRILARNGNRAELFFTRWIPLEQAYFAACELPEKCDYSLSI